MRARSSGRPAFRLGVVALALAALGATFGAAGAAPPDSPADLGYVRRAALGGWFFEQPDGPLGFGLVNYQDGPRFLDAYQRLGGAALGPVISRPWIGPGGYIYQLTQRVLLQWSPVDRTVGVGNLFEILQERGLEDELRSRHVPAAQADGASTFEESRRVRLGWLTDSTIAQVFLSNPLDPGAVDASILLHGLPMSYPVQFGPFVVQRFQRTALQHWVEAAEEGPPVGSVVLVNGGDIYRDLLLAGTLAVEPHLDSDARMVDMRGAAPELTSAEIDAPTERVYNAVDRETWEALGLLEGIELNEAGLQLAAELGVPIRLRPLPPEVLGVFSAPNRIEVNDDVRGEDRRVLAAILAHELTHLQDFQAGRLGTSRASCIAAETRAVTREAHVWGTLVGQAGKPPPATVLELTLNRRLEAEQAGESELHLLVTATYEDEC